MDKGKKTGLFIIDENRFATTRMIISVILSVSLLLSPVFLLFLISMPRVAMVSTVFGFVIAFSVVLSLVTEGKLQEILIGTAAYTYPSPSSHYLGLYSIRYGAFLATFLGNMNQIFVPIV